MENLTETAKRNLTVLATGYAKQRDIKFSTLSLEVHGNPRFLDSIRNGKGVGLTTWKYDQMMLWFSMKWSPDVPWPAGVPRYGVVVTNVAVKTDEAQSEGDENGRSADQGSHIAKAPHKRRRVDGRAQGTSENSTG